MAKTIGSDTLHDSSEENRHATMSAVDHVEVDAEEVDPFGDIKPGTQIGGRYVIEKRIGKGATGVVFEASHALIGKRVALKCLYPHHRAARISVERFFREAKIAATVEHPNVIEVYDGGDEGGVLYLAMELLVGETLGDRIDRGPMPLAEAVDTFIGILDGVAAVHEKGVIHRDLKPDNIFLVKARPGKLGGPKVLDFGISKLKEPGMQELTTLGTVMGTPFYMAPEQITNTRDVDARADVYSVAVMLFEALTGDVPYAEESVIDIFRRAQAGDTPPLHRLRSDVPNGLARLVEKAMRPKREDRFQSIAEMRDALSKTLLSDTDPGSLRPSPPEERATLRDMPTPLLAHIQPLVADEHDTPMVNPNVAHLASGERATVPVKGLPLGASPLNVPQMIRETPKWVWFALAAAGAMTGFSFMIALIALIW
jgi:serine/threonine protein kinase